MFEIGFVTGFLFVMMFSLIFAKKQKCSGAKYDERQILERGKAYKVSLYVYMTMNLVNELAIKEGFDLFDGFGGMIVLIIATVMIDITICIVNDAYMSLTEKPKQLNLLFSAILLINIFSAINMIKENGGSILDEKGRISTDSANLWCAIFLAWILIVFNIRMLLLKKEEE